MVEISRTTPALRGLIKLGGQDLNLIMVVKLSRLACLSGQRVPTTPPPNVNVLILSVDLARTLTHQAPPLALLNVFLGCTFQGATP